MCKNDIFHLRGMEEKNEEFWKKVLYTTHPNLWNGLNEWTKKFFAFFANFSIFFLQKDSSLQAWKHRERECLPSCLLSFLGIFNVLWQIFFAIKGLILCYFWKEIFYPSQSKSGSFYPFHMFSLGSLTIFIFLSLLLVTDLVKLFLVQGWGELSSFKQKKSNSSFRWVHLRGFGFFIFENVGKMRYSRKLYLAKVNVLSIGKVRKR